MACYVVTKWSPRVCLCGHPECVYVGFPCPARAAQGGRAPGQVPCGSGRAPLQGRSNPWLRGAMVSRQGCLGTK